MAARARFKRKCRDAQVLSCAERCTVIGLAWFFFHRAENHSRERAEVCSTEKFASDASPDNCSGATLLFLVCKPRVRLNECLSQSMVSLSSYGKTTNRTSVRNWTLRFCEISLATTTCQWRDEILSIIGADSQKLISCISLKKFLQPNGKIMFELEFDFEN